MAFRILEFLVTLASVHWIWSLPLSCLYNGTSHNEGETVRTDEPCLSCICQSGALECSLRVCAEYPSVLPPGCFLLHKPNHCCLQIFCDENFRPNGIELRTSFKSENKLHENDCNINGSIYGEGSAVTSSQPCEYCYCVEGDIKCIKPRCSQPFEGCKAVYGTSSCCPTYYDCRESNVSFLTSQMKNLVQRGRWAICGQCRILDEPTSCFLLQASSCADSAHVTRASSSCCPSDPTNQICRHA